MASPGAAPAAKAAPGPGRWGRGRTLTAGAIVAGGALAGASAIAGAPGMAPALLAMALFAALVVQRPERGVYATIGLLYLLPAGVLPFRLLGFRLTFLDVALTVTLVAWVARQRSSLARGLMPAAVGVPVLLLLGLATAAYWLNAESEGAARFSQFLRWANSVLFLFAVATCLTTSTAVERATQITVLGAGAAGAMALILYFLPTEASSLLLESLGPLGYPTDDTVLRYVAGTRVLRATATAVDPNVLGGMLALAVPLLGGQLLSRRPGLHRGVLGGVGVAVMGALLLTYSRGAWLGALVGLAGLAAFQRRVLWLLMGGALTLLLLLPLGDFAGRRALEGLLLADPATQMRLGEYQEALRAIAQRPLLGGGFGLSLAPDRYMEVSSIYLLVAKQTGLLGLGAFLWAMGAVFRTALRHLRSGSHPPLSDIQKSALCSVLGALTLGLFDHYFINLWFPHTVALFWLLVGLVLAASGPRGRSRTPTSVE